MRRLLTVAVAALLAGTVLAGPALADDAPTDPMCGHAGLGPNNLFCI